MTAPTRRPSETRLDELIRVAERIGHTFGNIGLLDRALTHASLGNEGRPSYERLEFLGDAVLGFLVAHYLYAHEREFPEGELTDLRARHVSRGPLAEIARDLELPQSLQVGRGLRTSELNSERIQADLVEAVLGAVYIDGGYRAARSFVRRHVLERLEHELEPSPRVRDPKSRLLHLSQCLGLGQPRYQLVDTDGPDHARSFTVEVLVDEEARGSGTARSKQGAEMIAAEQAIEVLDVDRSEDGAAGTHG